MTSKAKVLVVHGLAQKPAAPLLKAHVNYCLDCLRPDQITLLYWADLAGYPPRTWNSPADYRVSGKLDHLRRKVFGFTRQIARKGVEHSIAIALGLDPITCCGSTCFVPSTWIAAPVEKEARTLFGTQLREMANYFSAGSELRQGILQRVFTLDSNVFPARFDVAIGHSMGSVILADMLRTGAIMPVTHLVTIGSPLGLGVVRYALDEYYPAAFPLSQCYSG